MDWRATIEGLLAKAQASPYPNEAESLREKASYLAAKYGIDDAKARYKSGSKEKPIHELFRMFSPYANRKLQLLTLVAGCLGGIVVKDKNNAHVFGFKEDVERIKVLYFSLMAQMHIELSSDSRTNLTGEHLKTYKVAWLQGFITGVAERLKKAYLKAQEPGTDLVIARQYNQVMEEMKLMFPKVKQLTSSEKINSERGYRAGVEAGLRSDVGQTGLAGHTRSQIGT